jgi:preprotein translocase subunit SecA
MLEELKERVVSMLAFVELGADPQGSPAFDPSMLIESHPSADGYGGVALAEPQVISEIPAQSPAIRPYRPQPVDPDRPETWAATPRNAPCPCGSGKKYKHCHGRA